jgi:hypothetical protein
MDLKLKKYIYVLIQFSFEWHTEESRDRPLMFQDFSIL